MTLYANKVITQSYSSVTWTEFHQLSDDEASYIIYTDLETSLITYILSISIHLIFTFNPVTRKS